MRCNCRPKPSDAGASIVLQGDGNTAYERVVSMIDLVNASGLSLSVATARIGF